MAEFCLKSLCIWFEGLLPALFPFMFLSNLLILSHKTEWLTRIFQPFFHSVFRIHSQMTYVIIVGFLFGFPMGAKTIGQLYAKQQLTHEEASFLLAFCNHLSPVFLLSFLLPTLKITTLRAILSMLFLIYGIPFLYGLVLRYTYYRHKIKLPKKRVSSLSSAVTDNSTNITMFQQKEPSFTIFAVLDQALCDALISLAKIGGYMLLFGFVGFWVNRLCVLLGYSYLFFQIYPFIEISSGLNSQAVFSVPLALAAITLGGASCILQTKSMLLQTDLNLSHYLLHKLMQCCILLFVYTFYTWF